MHSRRRGRAKWSSSATASTSSAEQCSGESEQNAAGSSSTALTSHPTFQVGTEVGRMASAMERIAEAMPALILTLERSESTLSRIAESMNSIGQVSAPAPVTSAPAPVTSAPTPVTSAPGQSTSPVAFHDYNFDYPGANDDVDSEDGIDPFTKCGVCRGPPEKIYALDCGHYPYCEPCITEMTASSSAITYKFKCPCCNAPVINPLVLDLIK
ncbi:E3 ubiquitin-protein ligase TRIM31 [Frankliniella fusca]|uniref:E3 ubiquitin-protein ligase TRIM31 n=1 Tax=Frankliniella fusca TaxID=407009 RepID=A0AAE1HY26_9NEOP|nr:E3 ubiquitin-protein ligase TRIM31 [Frankliniella fusca]